MTIAAGLLNIPHDQGSWDIWAFTLDRNIAEITQAIKTQLNVQLPVDQLYPIPATAITEWLLSVSVAIGDIAGVLKINAADVENVDLQDERAKQAWIWQIFQEVQAARSILKI